MLDDYGKLTLCDLALSSYMYNSLTPFNVSLRALKSNTGNCIDLSDPSNRTYLVKWLNDWGCRHLSKEHLGTTSAAILDWDRQIGARLFKRTNAIWDLNDQDLSQAVAAYSSLKDKTAAHRNRAGKTAEIHIGPTAASKILFAIRPEALMPWDNAMRVGFGCDGSPGSYARFLRVMRKLARKISDLCNEKGFDITQLPRRIERPDATVLEIINEYIWITVTRSCIFPAASVLARGASWNLSTGVDEPFA